MKITNLSANELELKEGSASGMFVGAAFLIASPLAWYFLHQRQPVVVWVALGMAAVGALVILFSSSITVNANRSSGQLQYTKKRLIGGSSATYAIADVFRIETRKQWQMETTPGSGAQTPPVQQPMLVAQSVIVFRDGKELALDHRKTSSSTQIGSAVLMGGQGAETAMAAQVAKFLNVPFQEIAPPNMGAGINIVGV